MSKYDSIVEAVLNKIATLNRFRIKQSLYNLIGTKIHTLFKARPSYGRKFPFNINPTTLIADYELWVCGNENMWYLLPTGLLQNIYRDPQAYTDGHHPNIRVVTVDLDTHQITYAQGGQVIGVDKYFCKRI